LRNEHSVKGFVVMARKLTGVKCMGIGDWQRLNPIRGQFFKKKSFRGIRKRQPPEFEFDCDFPRTCGAPVKMILAVPYERPCGFR
jgi:hypothetical protein